MILVTAASGRTGRSGVTALGRAGHEVRAFDLDGDVEQLVGERGAAEALVGDLLNADDVGRAVDGVDAVVHIGPPMHPWEAEMGHVVVSAARTAGVEHFVQFSVTHPQLEPLLNHQAKLAVEREVLLSRLAFTILQPMHYMQNIDVSRVVAEGMLHQTYSLDTRLAHVDLEDVAEVAATLESWPRSSRRSPTTRSRRAKWGSLGQPTPTASPPKRTITATTPCSGYSTTTDATASRAIRTSWAGCSDDLRRASPSTSDGAWLRADGDPGRRRPAPRSGGTDPASRPTTRAWPYWSW